VWERSEEQEKWRLVKVEASKRRNEIEVRSGAGIGVVCWGMVE
jgi:hypothetical protein